MYNLTGKLSMAVTNLTVNHCKDEAVTITKQNKAKWIIPFIPLGKSSMKHSETLPAIQLIVKFNKAELYLLGLVDNELAKGNKLKVNTSHDRQAGIGIRYWSKKGLIKKIRKELYMVNPWFMPPSHAKEQEEAVLEWDTI